MKRRVISMVLTLGLAGGLLSGTILIAGANPNVDEPEVDVLEWIFYPFVPHEEIVDGTGPWYGAVTVQNVEDKPVRLFFFHYADFDPDEALLILDLAPYSAQTVTTTTLGIEAPGAPIAVAAIFRDLWLATDENHFFNLLEECVFGRLNGFGLEQQNNLFERLSCKPKIAGVQKQAAAEPITSSARTSSMHVSVDGHTAIPAQDIAWGPLSDYCWEIWGFNNCWSDGLFFGGSGGIGLFDGHSYLPIVQTNSGWNTVLHISNVDPSSQNAQVQLELITTDQQGFNVGFDNKYWFEYALNPGETWTLDLREAGVPDGWVGSAWLVSEVGMATHALRVKPSTSMLMINTAAPSYWATTSPDGDPIFPTFSYESVDLEFVTEFSLELYAPLIFKGFNGWNTGISIMNISERIATADITFYDSGGNAVYHDKRTISAGGQEFIYLPGYQNAILDNFVGSAVISSQDYDLFHVAVDQVKYETGEAMSYIATQVGARAYDPFNDIRREQLNGLQKFNDLLALPLLQKGNSLTGLGDTSGFLLFNADSTNEVHLEITIRNSVGALAEPTKSGPYPMTLGPMNNGILYVMDFQEMTTNFNGSAIIRATGGEGQVVGVSNNVNYAVQGDGAVAFNLVNSYGQFRLPSSQTPDPFDFDFPFN